MPRKGYQNLSLKEELLIVLDSLPGKSRPEKIEKLIRSAIALRGELEEKSPEAIASYVAEQFSEWDREKQIELLVELVRLIN